ncbi:NucA/NucB deoxyribonuclease domain-containing protein [Streptomyces sp. NPDC057939]|uniref:NucA/NucB deoxyribonuclease domain-containing protein n=1 Tax=Streptomyces sp. NPDC057939 TaxID=3346284 RepID=UPI0036E3A99C
MSWRARWSGVACAVLAVALAQNLPAQAVDFPAAGLSMVFARSTAAVECVPGPNRGNRFEACVQEQTTLFVYRDKKVVGSAVMDVTQSYKLKANSREFTETFTLDIKDVSGEAAGANLVLKAACGGTCVATVKVPGAGVAKGRRMSGTLTYKDTTTGRNTTRTTYTLTGTKPSFPPATDRWTSPDYRCDQEIGKSAGCVFPSTLPVLTTMAQLPEIAANIRRVQDGGPHHYGDRRRGSALTRTTDTALERANRNAACPTSRTRPTGKSCDEYPFARTNQGASKSDRKDWGWAWVPVSEQNQQGGFLSAFYQGQRVLNGDAFWVDVP